MEDTAFSTPARPHFRHPSLVHGLPLRNPLPCCGRIPLTAGSNASVSAETLLNTGVTRGSTTMLPGCLPSRRTSDFPVRRLLLPPPQRPCGRKVVFSKKKYCHRTPKDVFIRPATLPAPKKNSSCAHSSSIAVASNCPLSSGSFRSTASSFSTRTSQFHPTHFFNAPARFHTP
jgi:hypothetical protein